MSGTSGTPNNSNAAAHFKTEDKVFAKVKGYPYWPAKVLGIVSEKSNEVKYQVYFYGTEQTAVCKQGQLLRYVENRDKFGKPNKRLKEAIDKIEQDLDPSNWKKCTVGDNIAKDVGREFVTDQIPNQTKGIDKRNHASINDIDIVDDENTPIPLYASRSCCKINRKKISDDETDKAVEKYRVGDSSRQGFDNINSSSRAVNAFGSKRKKSDDNLNSDESSKKIKNYKDKLTERMDNLKNLPAGTNSDILRVENRLLELDCRIKSSLRLNNPDCEECLRAMDEMLELDVNALMLKKHPEVILTVRKARRYIGNVEAWNMSPEESKRFKEKAYKIRQKADRVHNKFKEFFTIPNGKSFIVAYNAELAKFKKKITNLSTDEVNAMVDEPEDED